MKKIITVLPWLLLIIVLSWLLIQAKLDSKEQEGAKEIRQSSILGKTEEIGKMELVKYNFQEVTELKKITEYVDLKIFKYKPRPDSKAVLISMGVAAGCVDLTKIKPDMVSEERDTIFITLPAPELCYFKLDLEKSRIYDLQIDYMEKEEQAKFMEELYAQAEQNVRKSAMELGILDQTKQNAQKILKPLFEEIAKKKVVLNFESQPQDYRLQPAL